MLDDDSPATRLERLKSDFAEYVAAYDTWATARSPLKTHRETMALRRKFDSVTDAVADQQFVTCLRQTLVAWGLGRRASVLEREPRFGEALRAAAPAIAEFEQLTLDSVGNPRDVAAQLWDVINTLDITPNHSKLVAGTKALHHLLPDLVVPMDRQWTGTFFNLSMASWQHPKQQAAALCQVFTEYADLARTVEPAQLATGQGWRTSRTKVIDNAVCAYWLPRMDDQRADDADNQISIEVDEYPPVKNEARSLFGAAHAQAHRVHALLTAAQQAFEAQLFRSVSQGRVAMEVVVRAPAHVPVADLTNMLGGIADVLQNKDHPYYDIDHLGDLAEVWIYENDRQITSLTAHIEQADRVGYRVTVRQLDGPGADQPR